jgi:hypothetical protein
VEEPVGAPGGLGRASGPPPSQATSPFDLGPGICLPRAASPRDGGGFGPAFEPFVHGVATALIAGSIRDGDPGLCDCLLGAMRTVLGSAVGETDTGRARLLPQIRTHIDADLGDPRLAPTNDRRAALHSVRQLHEIFESQHMTVGRSIRCRRLERCRAELSDPALVYGCSPQTYRRQCLTRSP